MNIHESSAVSPVIFFAEFREKQRIKYNIKSDHIVGRPLYLDAQATTPLVASDIIIIYDIDLVPNAILKNSIPFCRIPEFWMLCYRF